KTSQSDFASHGVAIAGLNGWTKGCMSVLLKSLFSYQVAAGRMISEYSDVPDMRKSTLTSKSNLPSAASSLQVTSSGRRLAVSSFINPWEVPRRCLRKYSCPLPELEMRLARHTNRTRGKL